MFSICFVYKKEYQVKNRLIDQESTTTYVSMLNFRMVMNILTVLIQLLHHRRNLSLNSGDFTIEPVFDVSEPRSRFVVLGEGAQLELEVDLLLGQFPLHFDD